MKKKLLMTFGTTLVEETLQAVMRVFLTRVHRCIEEGGGHPKDIVHKK